MDIFQTLLLVFTCIMLFLYGLRAFSNEIQVLGSEAMNQWLTKLTRRRWQAFMLGALFTAVIQSSSAVSSMTVALVDAGAFSVGNSLGVLLGAKVGTTSTAWLVSFKLTFLGPFFVVLGSVIGMVPYRINLIGRLLFYFGFILFSLQLLGDSLGPIKQSPQIIEWLRSADNAILAVLVGTLLTAVVQSSSVVSGLAVVLSSTGVIQLEEAVAIVVGCNLGTTSTALMASIKLNSAAKLAAVANFIFNLTGTLLFTPLVGSLSALVRLLTPDPAFQVAYAHLIFNLTVALIFLAFLRPFTRVLLRWREKE